MSALMSRKRKTVRIVSFVLFCFKVFISSDFCSVDRLLSSMILIISDVFMDYILLGLTPLKYNS